jgi:hypothetical protein
LAYQLELVGLDLGAAPSLDRTVVVAEAFLAEASGINERVQELEGERHHVAGALEEANEELASLPRPDAIEGDFIDLTGIESPVTVELTAEDVAELEAELAAAIEEEHETAERVEAREALVDAATQVQAVATARLMRIATELAEQQENPESPASEPAFRVPVDDVEGNAGQEAVEFYLLSRLASMRNVSYAGSVPLVVDDALTGLPGEEVRALLGKLERMAEAVQIIYLTDDEAITSWATEVGFQRAAVVDAPAPFT